MAEIDRQAVALTLPAAAGCPVLGGTLTLDESWSPFAQASVTIATPADLTGTDPRVGTPRAVLGIQQDWGSPDPVSALTAAYGAGTVAALTTAWGSKTVRDLTARFGKPYSLTGNAPPAVTMSADLGIRSRTVNGDGTTTLTLASDEALLQDFTLIVDPTTQTGFVNGLFAVTIMSDLRQVVAFVLDYVLPGATLQAGTATGTFTDGVAPLWAIGVSAWDYLAPYITAAGLRLWCDHNRKWHLEADPFNLPASVSLTYGANITDVQDTVTRDEDWYDAATLLYTWGPTTARLFNYDTAPVANTGFTKALYQEFPEVKAPPNGAAAAIRARALSRGRATAITAISNYNTQPGVRAAVTIPTLTGTGHIRSVAYDFESAEMQLSFRDLD